MNTNKPNENERLTIWEAAAATGILAGAAFGVVAVFGILVACEVGKGLRDKFRKGGGK